LIGVTDYQFGIILFSFSYIQHLETSNNIASKQLSKQDSILTYLNEVLTLERSKSIEKDTIIVNLETVIKDYKKARRLEKVKSTFTYIGLGLLAGAEAGVITYLLLK